MTSNPVVVTGEASIRAALIRLLSLDPRALEELKNERLGDLVEMMNGRGFSRVLRRVHLAPSPERTDALDALLTAREMQVVRLVCEGLTNKQIGRRLGLSDKTVKNHISKVLKKTRLSARTQIAVRALRTGVM
jgi:DNA-binding NarL/FixJ family response regulator